MKTTFIQNDCRNLLSTLKADLDSMSLFFCVYLPYDLYGDPSLIQLLKSSNQNLNSSFLNFREYAIKEGYKFRIQTSLIWQSTPSLLESPIKDFQEESFNGTYTVVIRFCPGIPYLSRKFLNDSKVSIIIVEPYNLDTQLEYVAIPERYSNSKALGQVLGREYLLNYAKPYLDFMEKSKEDWNCPLNFFIGNKWASHLKRIIWGEEMTKKMEESIELNEILSYFK